MKRYRQPLTHFILFYAGVFLVASLVGLVQELVGAGHNLMMLGMCIPGGFYMGFLGLYGWMHWVEPSEAGITVKSWRKKQQMLWSEVETVRYSRRGVTLSSKTQTIEVSRWLRHYLELHEVIWNHLPQGATPDIPRDWKAELTGGLRLVAHLNFWILVGAPSVGVGLGLLTQGTGGMILAAVSALVAFAVARWVQFPVVSIQPAGTGLHVKRAVGSIDLDFKDIDSLTLYEANQSPWSLHNGFRMGYGSAELRTHDKSIWIENPLCPEMLYHWLLRQGFALTPASQGCYRKLVRAEAR